MSAPKTVPSNKTQNATQNAQHRSVATKKRKPQVRLNVAHIYAEQATEETLQAVVDVLARLLDDRPASS